MPATSQSLTGLARVTGILAAAVLLSALFWIGTAVAATNTAYGELALSSDTSGTDNSAFGFEALGFNATGTGNTAVGQDVDVPEHQRQRQYRRWIHRAQRTTTPARAVPPLGSTRSGLTTPASIPPLDSTRLSNNTTGRNNTAVGQLRARGQHHGRRQHRHWTDAPCSPTPTGSTIPLPDRSALQSNTTRC